MILTDIACMPPGMVGCYGVWGERDAALICSVI